jgi:hypothetical protein
MTDHTWMQYVWGTRVLGSFAPILLLAVYAYVCKHMYNMILCKKTAY